MNKILYRIVALGALLVWTACSENSSPISGSTEIPNMGKDNLNENTPHVCGLMHYEEVVGDSIIIVDAYGTCYEPPEVILNAEDVPDSCKIEEKMNTDSIDAIDYTSEFKRKMESMLQKESLDSASRICAQKYSKMKTVIESRYDALAKNRLVKSVRCESGKVYITDGYKQFLKEFGVMNYDSLDAYTAAANLHLKELDAVFSACVESFSSKKNVIWDASAANSKTMQDSVNGSSIALFGFDSTSGNDSSIEWNLEEVFSSETAVFTLKDMENTPNVSLGIWLDGKSSKMGHKAFDVSDKAGVCFSHYAAGTIEISLDMGDSLNAIAGDNLYATKLEPSNPAHPQCVPWRNFKVNSDDVKIDRATALKNVTGFRYKFTSGPYWNDPVQFQIEKIYYIKL